MRITYIHQHFLMPDEAGIQRPWQFARRLAAEGHEVTILCGGADALETVREGVRIIRLEVPYDNSMSTGRRMRSFIDFMARSTWLAARSRADLVFASSTPLTTAVPGMLGAAVQRAPFVFEVRDLWPEVPIELGVIRSKPLIAAAKTLEHIAYRAARHVVALSPGMADGVRRASPNTDVTVVPNASDIEEFAPARAEREVVRAELGWGEEETVLFYAGGFGAIYGLSWLVELAAELVKRGEPFRVVMCGEGAHSDYLKDIARRRGLDPGEIFMGMVPHEQVQRMLPAADYAVSTVIAERSLEDASINKVFDALGAATPIIFNHGGWLSELVTAHGAGLRLERDPKLAADGLTAHGSGSGVRSSMAERAHQLARDEFDRRKLFERFHGVLSAAAR